MSLTGLRVLGLMDFYMHVYGDMRSDGQYVYMEHIYKFNIWELGRVQNARTHPKKSNVGNASYLFATTGRVYMGYRSMT